VSEDAIAWWCEQVGAWQNGHGIDASPAEQAGAREAERALWPALASLGERACHRHGLVRRAGSAAAEDVVSKTIYELFQVWDRMDRPPDNPRAFAWRRFQWRARNALRAPQAVSASVASEGAGSALVDRLAAPPRADPIELPRQVGQTLADATRFAAAAWRAGMAGLDGLPGPGANDIWREVLRVADRWESSATFVLDDVARGPQRRRWRHAPRGSGVCVSAIDNQQRSWQASYHEFEGHEGYTEAGEMPSSKHSPPGQAFDMHLSRFRKTYRQAAGRALEALAEVNAESAADDDARNVMAWEPAKHPTLSARTVANRKVAP